MPQQHREAVPVVRSGDRTDRVRLTVPARRPTLLFRVIEDRQPLSCDSTTFDPLHQLRYVPLPEEAPTAADWPTTKGTERWKAPSSPRISVFPRALSSCPTGPSSSVTETPVSFEAGRTANRGASPTPEGRLGEPHWDRTAPSTSRRAGTSRARRIRARSRGSSGSSRTGR